MIQVVDKPKKPMGRGCAWMLALVSLVALHVMLRFLSYLWWEFADVSDFMDEASHVMAVVFSDARKLMENEPASMESRLLFASPIEVHPDAEPHEFSSRFPGLVARPPKQFYYRFVFGLSEAGELTMCALATFIDEPERRVAASSSGVPAQGWVPWGNVGIIYRESFRVPELPDGGCCQKEATELHPWCTGVGFPE